MNKLDRYKAYMKLGKASRNIERRIEDEMKKKVSELEVKKEEVDVSRAEAFIAGLVVFLFFMPLVGILLFELWKTFLSMLGII
jgi:hypothetical protein